MTRALVTGVAGFIGSHLVDALLARGDEVTVVDHLAERNQPNLAGAAAAELVRGDVREVEAMANAFATARPEVVFHLAAQIDVRRSVADPAIDAFANIGGTASVLEAARRSGARRVVLASTAGVYGEPVTLPIPEDSPLEPLSPYGAGKAAAESYLQLFSRLYGLSTLSLRMSNVYGPRQSPKGEAGVIAIFCGAAARDAAVQVFGDGLQTRDFIYVGDVVDAFVAAGDADAQGAINVATGRETSLLELAAALGLETHTDPARLGEVRRSCLDPGKADRELGWHARTPLTAGLERTLAALASLPA